MNRRVGDYELSGNLGEGAYGVVRLAVHVPTGATVAVKVFDKQNMMIKKVTDVFEKELRLIQQLDHPLIVEFYEILEDTQFYYLFMEFVRNGTLMDHINNTGALNEQEARHYFAQMVSVLAYLHNDKYIVHRDFKADNILLDKFYNIRVTDFGLSNIFSDEQPYLSTCCGSPGYAAPEMILGQKYTKVCDVWSLGVVLFLMTTGEIPFREVTNNIQKLLQKVIYGDPQYPDTMSAQLEDLLKKILVKDPNERITLTDIMSHPWFLNYELAPVMNSSFGVAQLWRKSHTEQTIIEKIICKMEEKKLIPEENTRNQRELEQNISFRIFRKCEITDLMEKISFAILTASKTNIPFSVSYNSGTGNPLVIPTRNQPFLAVARRPQIYIGRQQTKALKMQRNIIAKTCASPCGTITAIKKDICITPKCIKTPVNAYHVQRKRSITADALNAKSIVIHQPTNLLD